MESTTLELPNTVVTQAGNPARHAGPTVVTPTPSATARPTTVELRMVKVCCVIIRMPVMVMVANTEIVAPPMTA